MLTTIFFQSFFLPRVATFLWEKNPVVANIFEEKFFSLSFSNVFTLREDVCEIIVRPFWTLEKRLKCGKVKKFFFHHTFFLPTVAKKLFPHLLSSRKKGKETKKIALFQGEEKSESVSNNDVSKNLLEAPDKSDETEKNGIKKDKEEVSRFFLQMQLLFFFATSEENTRKKWLQ